MTAAPQIINLSIDGQPVSVPKGSTIIQAAEKIGIAIPHFCWHRGLSIAGVCRFCMVTLKGSAKPVIACNTEALEGMDVSTTAPEAAEAQTSSLEFHLINHPLDCPICDQAGECGLQDYYMSHGRYKSRMKRPKVLKPKALVVGRDLVLDTERCILCSRCVRFENEVSKTNLLGILDRGDRSIIAVTPGNTIDHNYSTNIVDICPVGAFTSRDFRFKCRVWFLEDRPTICPGCSTGCHVTLSAKPQNGLYFRLKPRFSEVNGPWMCDIGRSMYAHLNPDRRCRFPMLKTESGVDEATSTEAVLKKISGFLTELGQGQAALLVAPQYTCEEYRSVFQTWTRLQGTSNVFEWREPTEKRDAFDGILYRGDHNANSAGLAQVMREYHVQSAGGFDHLIKQQPRCIIALLPEIPETFRSLDAQLEELARLSNVFVFSVTSAPLKFSNWAGIIPIKGYAEKTGTFLNQAGQTGHLREAFTCPVKHSMSLDECFGIIRAFSPEGEG